MRKAVRTLSTIATSIELIDRVSKPINSMIACIGNLCDVFESAERSMDGTFDTRQIEQTRRQIEQTALQVIQLGANTEDAENKQREYNNEVKNGSSAMDGLISKAGSLIAVLGLGKIVGDAIEFASNLQEVQNVVDVTFGASSERVNEWARTTLNAFGLNELSAKKMAGTMGAMLKSSGLAGSEVENMSMKLTELAGDMASFYNLEGQEAFDKLRAGISGETEPLKALGVNMSVANLEAYALSQGIKESYDKMSQAEQTMLRYNYIMQATADSQGDFARTSDSFANQQKLLSENWQALAGDIATTLLPYLAEAMQKLNTFIQSLRNNASSVKPIVANIGNALRNVTDVLIEIINVAGQVAQFFSNNWSTIEPIITGIVIALGAYYGIMKMINIVSGIKAAIDGVMATVTGIATAAQQGFNAALLACPITWIVIAIAALIAIIIALVVWFAKTSGAADSAFGVICGGVMVVITFFKNLGLAVANIALGIWNALGACVNNIFTAFHNVICSVQSMWYGLLATVLDVVVGICNALNKLPFISFDFSGIQKMADNYASKAAEANANKKEYEDVGAAFSKGFNTFEYDSYGDAFNKGAAWGDGFANSIEEADPSNIFDPSTYESGYDAGQVPSNIAATADNTGSMKDSMDISKEEIKYLRDIAERDAINRFTTAEINVAMTNNNNISSDMDLDGMVDYLVIGVNEAMATAAEGVH